MTVDARGNLYIVDAGNHRVRKMTTGGHYPGRILSRPDIAGVRACRQRWQSVYVRLRPLGDRQDGPPPGSITALVGQLNLPGGFALDSSGNLYFTETGAKSVSRLDASGNLTTLAAGLLEGSARYRD